MRVTTWNVNGLRAALRKGFADHLEAINPDVLLLQEIRVTPDKLPAEWAAPEGWHVHWHPAQKPGYAGTAVFSRTPIDDVATGLSSDDPDEEGRVLQVKTAGHQFVSIYLPSGSSGDHRQAAKEKWMARFRPWADRIYRKRTGVVLGGDLNIAHTEKDIFYAKGNAKNSGFLPHERDWFTDLLNSGWDDLVRRHFGDIQGPYSWWSNRGQARAKDRGWRIDYLLANRPAARRFSRAAVHREAGLTTSDHAPVTIDLDI